VIAYLRAGVAGWLVRSADRRLDRALREIEGIEGLSEERRAWFRSELRRQHAEVFGGREDRT
jgi:hypothetical protein